METEFTKLKNLFFHINSGLKNMANVESSINYSNDMTQVIISLL
ncbi:hypothetical protein BVRB_3g050550 [Beta vulgaris subsp. vulgaris]|uniref:Uncharacterized protein n=1 Tax=Beta vulgaris subsp. vulgaris TaxID=3555 RepID=A0A0J8CWF6_BETVV|nr:hypothetical protein BVRB_3g050550 [Beta vulgaris subsp. vulgaris]